MISIPTTTIPELDRRPIATAATVKKDRARPYRSPSTHTHPTAVVEESFP